ncbi:MAG: putative secondary metabolism biosynthetic enzyme [Pycnora praestabilis]|nr:MAG: putative secondary metabolism biosynthetic enzyme [Pycnora praestabilis]
MSTLRGKLIAITGAASGIGRSTALALATLGASLSLADIQAAPLRAVAEECKASRPQAEVIHHVVDVTQQPQIDEWISATVKHFERSLDGAANLAGVGGESIMTPAGLVRNLSNHEFDAVMRINVGGLLNCLRAELGAMKEGEEGGRGRGGGSIVNAASSAGLQGSAMATSYVASKHAVVGMTRCVAKEEGPRGIRVNSVAPGLIDTPLLDQLKANIEKSGAEFPEPAALGRRGTPEEVAQVIIFLLGDESSFVSGMVYGVDGGWVC